VKATSVPIGAVRLTERFLAGDPPSPAELAALEADISGRLAPLALPTGVPIVGTAGTATTLASVATFMAVAGLPLAFLVIQTRGDQPLLC